MTPKELLGLDAGDLEKLTTVELEAIFSPLFHVTRPEQQRETTTTSGPIKPPLKKQQSDKQRALLSKAMAIAKEHGIDLGI